MPPSSWSSWPRVVRLAQNLWPHNFRIGLHLKFCNFCVLTTSEHGVNTLPPLSPWHDSSVWILNTCQWGSHLLEGAERSSNTTSISLSLLFLSPAPTIEGDCAVFRNRQVRNLQTAGCRCGSRVSSNVLIYGVLVHSFIPQA